MSHSELKEVLFSVLRYRQYQQYQCFVESHKGVIKLKALVFSERELKFMFAMSSSVRPSVCRL